MTITADLPAASYHQDTEPTLSASLAHVLVSQSPRHAWTQSPALNPAYERATDEKFELGTVVHALLLQGEDLAYVVHGYDDWKKADAREARDAARADGRIPMLAAQREEVDAMLAAIRTQLADHEATPPMFADGKPEVTLTWDEDGIACKARLDWLREDLATIDDLKCRSREGAAQPRKWERVLYDHGSHIQAYVYRRAVELVLGHTPRFRWLTVETSPPYAIGVSEPGADVLACGQSDWEFALRRWRECLATGVWPAYGDQVARLEAPSWEMDKRAMREDVVA